MDLSLGLIDLDNFKGINHVYGYEVGDHLLAQVGGLISSHLRKSDHACRFSGQHFAVLFVNTGRDAAETACERFRRLLSEYSFNSDDSPIFIRASIGFATLSHGEDKTDQDLLNMASTAMKNAKEAGRDCVTGYG